MDEIEVKILEINKEEVEKKLLKLGAKKIFDDDLKALMFDLTDLSIASTGRMLRIRKEGKDKAVLTFKKLKSDDGIKIAEETEVDVSNFEDTQKILEGLDFKVYFEYEKHRITYELDGVEFAVDTYTGEHSFIPTFMEIEGESEEKVFRWVEKLGFKKEDCKGYGLSGLLKHYGKSAPEMKF
jgi:adenylate cyclase, class 2